MKSVVVIGGGIIGLCSAYYLQKEGHKVTVIDQSNMDSGASYVNAGYLSPSHIIPLAAPGVMKAGIKWMFNTSSPLFIKPRLDKELVQWAWAFNKSCNAKHVEKAAPVIRDICVLSQELFSEIIASENFNAHYEKKGLMVICQTEKMLEQEMKAMAYAKTLHLESRELSASEMKAMQSHLEMNTIGGIFYDCDHHSTPHEFMTEMKVHLEKVGVVFCSNEKVYDLVVNNGKITQLITEKQRLSADEYVLSSGSWASILSKKLGIKLLLQAGKGYRINTENPVGVKIPAILAERKVAITPMHGFTRFAGTMEISGINHKINSVRVEAIANAIKAYFPTINTSKEEKENAACGLRPVSADGLPYIGKSSKCKNLTIATGHAMMGWSMGPATGKLVSQIISEQKRSLELKPFAIERKF